MDTSKITPEILTYELQSTPNMPFMEFLHIYEQNIPDAIFIAVEGQSDSSYYRPRLQAIKRKSYEFIVCNSRKNVLAFRSFIQGKNKYKDAIIGYIIDRDYEDNRGIPADVYITPCHSIENFYCSQTAFSNILNDHFHLKKSDPRYRKIIDFHIDQYTRFLSAILPFYAWYLCLLERGYRSVIIKDFVDKYINIRINHISKKYTIDLLEERYTDAPKIPMNTIYKKMSMLRHNSRSNIRGKDILKFMIIFLKFIKKEWNSEHGLYYKEENNDCRLQLCSETVLAELSSIADPPHGLDEYIYSIIDSQLATNH